MVLFILVVEVCWFLVFGFRLCLVWILGFFCRFYKRGFVYLNRIEVFRLKGFNVLIIFCLYFFWENVIFVCFCMFLKRRKWLVLKWLVFFVRVFRKIGDFRLVFWRKEFLKVGKLFGKKKKKEKFMFKKLVLLMVLWCLLYLFFVIVDSLVMVKVNVFNLFF